MHRAALALLLGPCLMSCSPESSGPAGGVDSAAAVVPEPPAVVGTTCDLASIGLADATRVTFESFGCEPREATAAPIRDEAAFQAAFGCPVPSGLDLATHEVHVEELGLTTTGLGFEVVDDGATLTFVSLHRAPCEGEPHLMVMPVLVAYLLPSGAERVRAEAGCRVGGPCE